MILIYTSQRSKQTKKQKAKEAAILKEQRAIKEQLKKLQNEIKNTGGFVINNTRTYIARSTDHIPSVGDGIGTAVAKDTKVYTGDKMIGISSTHKSNDVPVFSKDYLIDISKMRR